MKPNAAIRFAAVMFLSSAACAHDHALDKREVGEMKNASPALSPWPGPVVNPVADESPDALVNRVQGMAVQIISASGTEKINVASGVLAGGGLVLTDLRALLGGHLRPVSEIAVLTAKGAFPARIVGGAIDAGLAA